MKRLWMVIALLLLLCGCGEQPHAQTTEPAQTTSAPTVETTAPTQPDPGLYVPDSDVERQTGGAVREYSLTFGNVMDVVAAGDRLLVISSCNIGSNIAVLTGDRCVVSGQAMLTGCAAPTEGTFRVTQEKLAYYDGGTRCVVILDSSLKETGRILLPEQTIGSPVISQDLSTVFYCTQDKIHALDTSTGITRLIRQHSSQWQSLNGSLFEDTVLQCQVIDENDRAYTCFLSAETGQLLGEDTALRVLHTFADRFFLTREEGCLPEHLFGDSQGSLQALLPEETVLYSVLSMDAVIGMRESEEGTALSMYDLSSGKRSAEVVLCGVSGVYDVTADPAGRYVWISVFDREAQQDMLYRWEPALSGVEQEHIFIGKRFTSDDPDIQGIEACKEKAVLLGQQYGVEIYLGEDVIAPWDYTLIPEYRVEAFLLGLQQLEKALSAYPEGFLATMVEETGSGVIRFSLVRQISGDVAGVQYWIEGDAYIALEISEGLEQDTYHEISHVLDNYIIANCYAYDDWEELNPQGAVYDYSYSEYQTRTDWTWLEGEDRAFIDSYSMTYPKEDRARILEYAMTPGNAELFRSEHLQGKLIKICKGIRESFGYERYEETFLWEQYLNTSLAYTKKK